MVESRSIDTLVVKGHDNRVTLPSARVLRLASPGSVVDAEGLLEEVSLGRRHGTVEADQISGLRVGGRGHDVKARRGYDVTVPGDRSDLDFRRLRSVALTGQLSREEIAQLLAPAASLLGLEAPLSTHGDNETPASEGKA